MGASAGSRVRVTVGEECRSATRLLPASRGMLEFKLFGRASRLYSLKSKQVHAAAIDRLRLGQGNKELAAGLEVSLVALEDRLGIDPG